MEVKEFKGKLHYKISRNEWLVLTPKAIDQYMYGFYAEDENGNRVDPTTIRQRASDGAYVIITK